MKKIFKDKQLLLVITLCVVATVLYLKTNDDPLISILRGTFLESYFYKFETGNSLLKDLSIGILVSSIFWLFNVYLPEKKKIKGKVERLNKALKLILESFGDESGMHHWDKHYTHCAPLSEDDLLLISRVRKMLNDKDIYGLLKEKYFYEICSESSDLYYFLSISASELSPEHGELWDSITRSVKRVADIYPQWCSFREEDGYQAGKDYSNGLLSLNLTEFLESLEKWIKLNK